MSSLSQAGQDAEYLTAEREAELVAAAHAGDKRARDQLVMSHLKLVAALASKYRAHHDFDSLMSAGMIGLLTAVDKFKTDKGARFGTYCVWHVKAEMFKLMQKESNLVSFPDSAGRKRAFFNVAKSKHRLGIHGEPTDAEISAIAADLQVTEDDVRDALARKRTVLSLNVPLADRHGTAAAGDESFIDHLEDESLVPADEMLIAAEQKAGDTEALQAALASLKPRQRLVLERRLLTDEKATLEELSQELGVSRERCRQLQVQALKKVEAHLTGKAKPKVVRAKRATRAQQAERLAFVRANKDSMRPIDMAKALGVHPTTVRGYLRRIEREALPLAGLTRHSGLGGIAAFSRSEIML